MKKVRMFLTAAVVLSIVGSALAFDAKINPNLNFCQAGKCVAAPYHTTTGTAIANPGNLFAGTRGANCPSAQCSAYTAPTVFQNQ